MKIFYYKCTFDNNNYHNFCSILMDAIEESLTRVFFNNDDKFSVKDVKLLIENRDELDHGEIIYLDYESDFTVATFYAALVVIGRDNLLKMFRENNLYYIIKNLNYEKAKDLYTYLPEAFSEPFAIEEVNITDIYLIDLLPETADFIPSDVLESLKSRFI